MCSGDPIESNNCSYVWSTQIDLFRICATIVLLLYFAINFSIRFFFKNVLISIKSFKYLTYDFSREKSGRHKIRKGNVCKAIKKILDLCDFVLYKAKVFCRGIAQLVEHRSPKPRVVGSSPPSRAKRNCYAEENHRLLQSLLRRTCT